MICLIIYESTYNYIFFAFPSYTPLIVDSFKRKIRRQIKQPLTLHNKLLRISLYMHESAWRFKKKELNPT